MCGNGIRCVGKYLYDNGMTDGRTTITIDTLSGVKTLELTVKDGKMQSARVDMGAAILAPGEIPVDMDGENVISAPIVVDEKVYHMTCVSMGNPHCVIFQKEDVDDLDLTRIGPKFEHHPLFPERVNTEFVNVLPDGSLKMRVWERGSGETWACGTGSCATGVAACLNGFANKNEDIVVHLRGGDLTIRYTDETVFMTGAATTVFKGKSRYDKVHLRDRRRSFRSGQGHYCRISRPSAEKPRPENCSAEARSLHQRRPGHDEPVPAR